MFGTTNNDYTKTTIALAGMMQAVTLVRDLAQTGKADDMAFQSSIYSIFQTNPKNVPEVYNNLSGIKFGLESLLNTLNNTKPNQAIMRYMMSIIHLQKKISRSTPISNHLTQRIQQTQKQVDYFSLTHPTVISNLADIYLNAISSFRFRIMIWGSSRLLNTSEIMEKIRALLLASIRSAVLWRQVGGSRIQLLLFRSKIKMTAEKILSQINEKERV